MNKAVVLLCIALSVSVAAAAKSGKKGESTWLTDYLEVVPKATTAASAYEEVDSAHVCFRTSTYCEGTCDSGVPECKSTTDINTLACSPCPEEEDYSSYKYPGADYLPEMGLTLVGSKCMINKQYTTPVGMAGKPGVSFVGTFTGTCYLMENKDHSCNLPETCEYVVASVQGVIYEVAKAIRVGSETQRLQACLLAPTPATAQAKAAGYEDEEYPNRYSEEYPNRYPEYDVTPGSPYSPLAPIGPATILSGPFTLHGVGHKLKYNVGHFQYSIFHNTTTMAKTDKLPRLGDDVYKFEFQADKHY